MRLPLFLKKPYYPLNRIEISKEALLHNYQYLSCLASGIAVAPVLKSNAYGHGLVLVAKMLDDLGAPFFCVDSLYEAYELLKHKIKTPVLIMGYVNPQNLKVKKLPFSYAVYDREVVSAISKYQPHAAVHIFVDTGMHREGILLSQLPEFLSYIKSFGNLRVAGLMSHFAAADHSTNTFTKKQVENFAKAKEIVLSVGFSPKWFHISASGGLLNHETYRGCIGNLARAGISLYGIDPEGKDKNLQPALRLTTTLHLIKKIPKGEKIGYDFTYTAEKNMMIGILPLGYYDGADRRLSNKGFVSINDVFCPIIGRVSMNLTTIDITAVKNPQIGDKVIIYSSKPDDKNSIANSAKICGTIPYDLLVHLASSTRRIAL